MSKIVYLTIEQAIETHRLTVEKSYGGSCDIIDTSRLETVLEMIKNDDYYPNFVDKITHLCFSTCNCHCFADGNKRLALTLSLQFLSLNGYFYCCIDFLRNMENIILNLAQDKISKELLHEIFQAIIDDDFDNESLQLKIFDAISQ
jgi:death-on-curing family protein